MKLYTVKVPIVAVCYVDVEAENKQEAIEKAMESEDVCLENVDEWDALEHIVEGNVIHTYNSDAVVVAEQEIEESEEQNAD